MHADESPPKNRTSLRRRLGTFIFFALLTLIAFAAIPYGSVEPWWRALFECLVFALAALSLIEIWLSGDFDLSRYSLLWPLVALAVFAFIQTLPYGRFNSPAIAEALTKTISADPHGTRNWVTMMFALILMAAMLLRYGRDQRRFKLLVYLAVGIAVASAIFGFTRQMMQHQPGFGLPYLRPGLGYAQFINKNHFAFLMEMGFGVALGLLLWRGLSRERSIIAIAFLLLLGGTLVLANSRGGILSLFAELLFGALLFSLLSTSPKHSADEITPADRLRRLGRSALSRAVLLILFLIVISVGVILIGGAPLATSLEAVPTEIGASADSSRWAVRRWDIWPATVNLIKDNPIAGVGFGGYWMAFTKYHNASGEMTPQQAHNDYLEFVASGGVISVALGGWFLFLFIRNARNRIRTRDRFVRAARCGALIGISGVAVHSLVDFGLHIPANAAVFFSLIVISTIDLPSRKHTSRNNHSS